MVSEGPSSSALWDCKKQEGRPPSSQLAFILVENIGLHPGRMQQLVHLERNMNHVDWV